MMTDDASQAGYDQTERFEDPEEATRSALDARLTEVWTAMPVIIKKHDTDSNTAHVQVVSKLKHVKADGTVEWKEFPLLKDVPINYHGGGGMAIVPPLKDGDEGIVMFASRDFDRWWNSGGVQEQDQLRMHDISNGWLIPGGRSQPRKLKDINPDVWHVRSDDGSEYLEFNPTSKTWKIKSANPVTIDAPSLRCTGEIIAKYTGDNIHLSTHVHQQDPDSHGDTEQDTKKPKVGS